MKETHRARHAWGNVTELPHPLQVYSPPNTLICAPTQKLCESFLFGLFVCLFFNFGFIYFIYLFIYGCVGSSFLCWGFL